MNSAEIPAPYGTGSQQGGTPSSALPARIRVHHLQAAKDEGRRFAMLTAYDQYAAQIFDEAGIEVLLVGDSAANNVLGHATTLPITLDEMILFSRAVAGASKRSLVVADLPFGSYEVSPAQGVESSVRLMKEGLVHAVKMEGGKHHAETVRAIVQAGIPVMAHVGFTPQSEHSLGGYRVQGRGEAARTVIDDAVALAEAGAFCVLMEMVPADVAAEVDRLVAVPTIGIGAGSATTGQVLVWQDMAGLRLGKQARFVKKFADVRTVLSDAARAYADEVREGTFPGPEHSF
ncbi:3-methyl-2-oxobutanoate hydroxymethyltransferase [Arthrobacter sp. JZ12]|uniref:3-methyl-2-oxobutanoate hydroxymethyltransferase n=1 Tax=Arthrobacter sp. JZ12 TaxID=2654190 RepID=UPI002B46F24E|nr:3-methyl-2-oxobutanoate hydroxymethyltransferase [Arthrobacter sp. JZ12]WRH24746.1 3-methyl-2-oxobutanoate hydroxymethyltransferase [Arthrobacter sp. JZ12]